MPDGGGGTRASSNKHGSGMRWPLNMIKAAMATAMEQCLVGEFDNSFFLRVGIYHVEECGH